MDYEQFKTMFAGGLKTNLQKQKIEVDVSEYYIEKLSDSYDALSVTPKGSNIGVNVSLDEIFHAVERERDYSEVLSKITESLKNSFEYMPKLQVSDLTNYAETRNKLIMKVISVERNAGVLQSVPHKQMEDIAAVYCLVLNSSKDASSTVLVISDLMDRFGITHEQFHNDAMKNAPFICPAEIKGMEETLNEMQDGPILESGSDEVLFAASIPDQNHGAIVIACPNFPEDAAEEFDGDYLIVPSSVHEMLLVKDTGEVDVRDLAVMIREINATEVAPEDVLTDYAYHYDSKEHIFRSVDKFEECQAEMEAAGPEEDRGSLTDQLNTRKKGATKEAPEKAVKNTVRKSRGGKVL